MSVWREREQFRAFRDATMTGGSRGCRFDWFGKGESADRQRFPRASAFSAQVYPYYSTIRSTCCK